MEQRSQKTVREMVTVKYELTEKQMLIIRKALEDRYHICKDEDETGEEREAITELEDSLIAQSKHV